MKILYITTSLFRNESASIRNISLLNGIVENNVAIDVITLNFKNEDKKLIELLSKKIKIRKLEIKLFNKIQSTKSIRKNKENKIKNVIKNILFFPDTLSESIREAKKINIEKEEYDFIVSSSDSKTSHFIANVFLKKFKKKPSWIQIWGDPWQTDIGLNNLDFITKVRIKFYEDFLLRKANKIFYISELTADFMKIKYYKYSKKIQTIPRSYINKIETKNYDNKQVIFSYTGTLVNRNIRPLIETIKKYNSDNQEKKIELRLYGIDEEMFNIKEEFIKIFPRVSFEKIQKVYEESDVLIYLDNLYDGTQIPGKIYDYFGTNKVILGIYENEKTNNYLKVFNRIELYKNEENKINLNEVINKIGTRQVLEEFSSKRVAEQFLKDIGER